MIIVFIAQEHPELHDKEAEIIGVYAQLAKAKAEVAVTYEMGIAANETVEWSNDEQLGVYEYVVDGDVICYIRRVEVIE